MHMSLTKLSLAGNGKTANLFYGVPVHKLLVLHVSYIFEMFIAYMLHYTWHVPPLLMWQKDNMFPVLQHDGSQYSITGFIRGILRGVRYAKSLRVLFLHRWSPSWTTLVLYSRAVFIFNEPTKCLSYIFLLAHMCIHQLSSWKWILHIQYM